MLAANILKLVFGPRGESLTSQCIIKDKHINHDNHHDESKTSLHRDSVSSIPQQRPKTCVCGMFMFKVVHHFKRAVCYTISYLPMII